MPIPSIPHVLNPATRWRGTVVTAVLTLLAIAVAMAPPASAQEAVPAPAPEAALARVRSVVSGYHHSCALLENRQVRCWGDNGGGQLGNGQDEGESYTPLVTRNASGLGPLRNVAQLALGDEHTCALLTSGQVRCWGANSWGQLGNGNDDTDAEVPLPVVVKNPAGSGPLQGVRAITASSSGTCALLRSSEVRCWGDDNEGQLGDGTVGGRSSLPVAVRNVAGSANLRGVTSIDGGGKDFCAVLVNGQARCWGDNFLGGLGDGNAVPSALPVVVRNGSGSGPLTRVVQISAGDTHTCARLRTGQLRCWGGGSFGKLGDGAVANRPYPVVVRAAGGAPLTGVRSIVASRNHTCARTATNRVLCWGDDRDSQLGDGTPQEPADRPVPRLVRNRGNTGALRAIVAISSTDFHTCVRRADGRVLCWGMGDYGALGYGDYQSRALPVLVQA